MLSFWLASCPFFKLALPSLLPSSRLSPGSFSWQLSFPLSFLQTCFLALPVWLCKSAWIGSRNGAEFLLPIRQGAARNASMGSSLLIWQKRNGIPLKLNLYTAERRQWETHLTRPNTHYPSGHRSISDGSRITKLFNTYSITRLQRL